MVAPHRGSVLLRNILIAACVAALAWRPATSAADPDDPSLQTATERIVGAALTSDHAWNRLSELCDGIGHRLSGSPSLERAVVWARDAMREDGLDSVWLQPVQVPRWVRGNERAQMVAPRDYPLSILGLGRSVGTRRNGLTADVVVVRSFDELEALPADQVRGKIVLYNVPFTSYSQTVRYRTRGANRASRRGAVASLVRSVGPVSLRTPHTGNMSAYNDSFPRIPAAAVTIEDAEMIARLIERDQRVRVRLEMEADTLLDAPSHNVIGELRGRELPDEIVVIGGHLDSWDVGQGAHDDGGGCVITMEALRLLERLDLRPRRTLRCVLWTNEENGTRGGKAYAKAYGASQRHVAALESDGGVERPVGFGVSVWRDGVDSTHAAKTAYALDQLQPMTHLLAGIGAGSLTGSGGGADIKPLMQLGVPGIAHRTVREHYFDWHHTPADMMDKVDPVELRRNVAAMAVMAYILAEMPGSLLEESPSGR